MSAGLPIHSSNSSYEHSWPNQHFLDWLRTQTSLFVGQIITILAFPSTVIALIYYSTHNGLEEYITPLRLQTILVWLHIPFLLLFLRKFVLILNDNKTGAYRTNMVYKRIFKERKETSILKEELQNSQGMVKTFKIYLIYFIVSLLLLYIVFAINMHHSGDIQASSQLIDKPKEFDDPWKAWQYAQPSFWEYCMNNISMLFIFMCFTLLYVPPTNEHSKIKQNRLIHFAVVFICLLIISFPIFILVGKSGIFTESYLKGYATFFNALSGVLNAVFLALLISRLDSKLIGLPSDLISVLYIYAAVQPLFVVFQIPSSVNDIIKTAVLAIVFIFKIYFFFITIYILQTGRLLNYFFCFPELSKLADSIFRNQFEITLIKEHSNKFSYRITKGKTLVFTSDLTFTKRRDCLNAIKHLRAVLKKNDSYEIRKYGGTYWIDVIDEKKNILCNSHNLKTREEAEELRKKANERLPYCKLNYS